ncbi:hypothetical protein [Streptomyces sp. B21-083]
MTCADAAASARLTHETVQGNAPGLAQEMVPRGGSLGAALDDLLRSQVTV